MNVVDKFKEALTVEIEEQKKKGTARWDVRAGKLVEVRGPLFVYGFILDDPTLAGAFDDTPVLVRTAECDASGHIVGISGNQIFVAIESNLGDYVSSARILAQPYYLLEQLSERLGTLKETSCIISAKCIERQPFQYQKDVNFVPKQQLVAQWDSLNDDQRTAIRQALGSEVCYIWGPPGTSKTTTIGVTVASMIQLGQTILLTSNTNVVVDQALTACLKPLRETEHYADGRILRLGTPQIKEIADDEKLNLDKITEFKSRPLREQLLNLREKLVSIESRFAVLEALETDVGQWEEMQRQITGEESTLISIEDSLKPLTHKKSIVEKSLQQEKERYSRAKTMPAMMRFLRGMTLSKIENFISSLEAQRNTIVDQETKGEARANEITSNLERLRVEAKKVERKFEQKSVSLKSAKK